MKSKIRFLSLIGVIALSLTALAQSDTAPASDGSTNNTQASPAAEPADTAQATDVAQAAPAPDAAPAADAAAAAPAVETAAAAPAADAAEAAPAAEGAAAPAQGDVPVQPGALIPLIVMDDVPLTDAIRNLARQAGLNYMLDPKMGYGQPGPDGRVVPQPMVSLRWENVTAEQALMALLANYNLQLAEDPKTKIARVTVKDPAAPDPLVTRVFQLKYASPTNILESVVPTFTDKRSKAVGDVRTSQVVILATDKELVEIEKLIDDLDTPTRQVLIEARLVETSLNPSTVKGLDWAGTLQGQNIRFGNNLQQNTASESINNTLSTSFPKLLFDTARGFNPATAFLDADGVSVVLSFLNKYSEAKVLSTPRTVTLDNETAFISVTRAMPIFRNTAGTQGSPGGSEVTYTNLGVILHVTPRISANDLVNLKVTPEVSRVFDVATKKVADTVNQADIYDIRKIETRVMIPSGNTLVLGGLIQDDIRKSNTKVPLLGDIPLLGHAFRSDTQSRQKQNLLIFITPTIVKDEDFQVTQTDFLKSPVPTTDAMEPDWSSWNSGKPKDWSKNNGTGGAQGTFSEVDLSTKE
jgi:type II secretory pathway component GspD/PulD (secretin)